MSFVINGIEKQRLDRFANKSGLSNADIFRMGLWAMLDKYDPDDAVAETTMDYRIEQSVVKVLREMGLR
jgi:hypothetical protein